MDTETITLQVLDIIYNHMIIKEAHDLGMVSDKDYKDYIETVMKIKNPRSKGD